MKRFTLMMAFAFVSGAFAPLVSGAQERVAPFDGLTSPRITLPDDHEGAISHRHMCPESNDTCRPYLSYTGYFVRNATIPHRERELLILRTAWLSRGKMMPPATGSEEPRAGIRAGAERSVASDWKSVVSARAISSCKSKI